MSRPRNLKLEKLADHEAQPHISIVGHGKQTFLWVGDRQCYSFTHGSNPRELFKFAEAIIRRVMRPYKSAGKTITIKL
jgi:hypothetical protein